MEGRRRLVVQSRERDRQASAYHQLQPERHGAGDDEISLGPDADRNPVRDPEPDHATR